jgi:iduronate 2-sulfatase
LPAGNLPYYRGKVWRVTFSGENRTIRTHIAYTVSYQGRDATLRTERWRYTRWGENIEQGNEELYDHKNDPEEFVNLADNADYKSVMKDLRIKFERAREKARTGLKTNE